MKQSVIFIVLISISTVGFSQSIETAIRQYENRELDKADKAFKAVGDDNSAYAEAQYYLGRIAFDQEKYEDAEEYLEEALDIDDSKASYHFWYGNAIGRIAQNSNVLKQGYLAPKVKNSYERAVELDPKMLGPRLALVEYYVQAPGFMGGSWEKAIETAKIIKTLDKAEGYKALASVFIRQEKPDEAEQELLSLFKLDSKYIFNLGYFYQNQKQYDKAFDLFEKGYQTNQGNLGLLYQIGRNSALSGQQPEKGIKSLERYLTYDEQKDLPPHAVAKMRLAMIYEKSNKKELAKKNYQEALAKDPEMKLAKEGLARVSK